MILIVGLGNPGEKYKNTRHNIGFRVIDEFLKKNRDVHIFSDFKFSKKILSLVSKGQFNKEKIILAKPQTLMNNSGKSIKKIVLNLKSEISNLFVIHDDIDLSLGKIKIVKNRGSAGHKGVQSIIDELGTKNFVRFRIGIRPQKKIRMQRFVLKNFNKEEEKIIKKVIKTTVEAIEVAIIEGLQIAMTKFNASS